MSRSSHPTTDLYFWNSCRGWVRSWRHRGVIRRLGANCFAAGNHLLLLRRDELPVMQMAISWPGHLTYLIDDDIDAATATPSLPDDYRRRLIDFSEQHYRRLLARADVVVVSSAALMDQLAADYGIGQKLVQLDPYWDAAVADFRHFDDGPGSTLEMVHLGSGSHSGALQAITPTLLRLLDETAQLRFSYVGMPGLHPQLDRHDRVRRLHVKSWPRYRRWLPRQRFHIALYPLEQTRFDRARSANKLFEHCMVGAVGVYPRDWAPASAIGQGAILMPPDPARWHDDLREAISDRAHLHLRAQEAARILTAYFTPSIQRQFWQRIFDMAT